VPKRTVFVERVRMLRMVVLDFLRISMLKKFLCAARRERNSVVVAALLSVVLDEFPVVGLGDEFADTFQNAVSGVYLTALLLTDADVPRRVVYRRIVVYIFEVLRVDVEPTRGFPEESRILVGFDVRALCFDVDAENVRRRYRLAFLRLHTCPAWLYQEARFAFGCVDFVNAYPVLVNLVYLVVFARCYTATLVAEGYGVRSLVVLESG
jgi:hypothetical protein